MKQITVNFCDNCPFLTSQSDDSDLFLMCSLAYFLNKEKYTESSSFPCLLQPMNKIETPDWCDLKKEGFIFNFKELDPEKIDSTKGEIKELNINPDFFDEKFQEDLNMDIDKIKKQIESLQDFGNKLTETFKSLGEQDNNENNENH